MRLSEKEFNDLLLKGNIKLKEPVKAKSNKYLNVKIYVYDNGLATPDKIKNKKALMVFDSTKEYNRYCQLKMMERAGEIFNLDRQKTLTIIDDFTYKSEKIKGINYKADFCYKDKKGNIFVEDVKPYDEKLNKYRTTKDFNLKWKMLKNKYPEYYFVIF